MSEPKWGLDRRRAITRAMAHPAKREQRNEVITFVRKVCRATDLTDFFDRVAVEDDMRNIYSLTSILEPHGVSVEIARNGREAITMLEKAANDTEKAIDLVLMDVMMPEMDGLTATREIRKNSAWRKLPIIMLTAKAMKDDQEKCMAAGANDYMAKPLDVEKLLSLVRVWIPR